MADAKGTTGGGITKYGSQRLNIEGDGTYTGPVDVHEGVLSVQNDTATGLGGSTTTVEAGAALEFNATSGVDDTGTATTPDNTGGVSGAASVWNEHLILNGSGNTTAPPVTASGLTPIATVTSVEGLVAGTLVTTDSQWHGPVTLGGTPINVLFQNGLGLFDPNNLIGNATNLTVATGSPAASISVGTTQIGGPSLGNAMQTITFDGAITGGTFTLTYVYYLPNNAVPQNATTGSIPWNADPRVLAQNIQAALSSAGDPRPGQCQRHRIQLHCVHR